MNVERLLSVLDALVGAAERTGLEKKTSEIVDSLQTIVNDPSNASHPQALAARLAELAVVAKDDTLQAYPVLSREIIVEFNLENLVAAYTEQRLNSLIQSNAATPSNALAAATEIRDEISSDLKALREIKAGLRRFHVSPDDVPPERAGLAFVIPRGEQSVPTTDLIRDLRDFEFIENAFERVVTGHQTGARVRSLASSDFAITLDTPIGVGLAIAVTIQYIIARYQEILNLRRSHIELKRLKSEVAADAVEKDIEARVKAIATEVAEAVTKRFSKGAAEDKILLEKATLRLARMVDQRYRVEVRVSKELPSDDSEDKEATAVAAAHSAILKIQSETVFFEAQDAPLLLIEDSSLRDDEDSH